jgi:hypothetical protein
MDFPGLLKIPGKSKKLSLESRPLWVILAGQGLRRLSCQTFRPQSIHQSLIFGDQLWASLSSATLDFKQSLHQLG